MILKSRDKQNAYICNDLLADGFDKVHMCDDTKKRRPLLFNFILLLITYQNQLQCTSTKLYHYLGSLNRVY